MSKRGRRRSELPKINTIHPQMNHGWQIYYTVDSLSCYFNLLYLSFTGIILSDHKNEVQVIDTVIAKGSPAYELSVT